MLEHEQKIKELIRKDTSDLVIRRVPKNHLTWFKEYAKEEYAGDYGMLLRELIVFYRGMLSECILSDLTDIKQMLVSMTTPEEKPKEQPAEVRRMASGRTFKK